MRKREAIAIADHVVAFEPTLGAQWVGNFGRGLSNKDAALPHPDGRRVLVIAGGALYEVDPVKAEPVDVADCCVTEILHISYLNCFVLIVQAFLKVPALKSLAPTQSEPPFKLTQLIVLVGFVVLGVVASMRFRTASMRSSFVSAGAMTPQ